MQLHNAIALLIVLLVATSTQGRITFQFSEGDYLVSSGDTSMLELEVTSSGSHGGVTLRVIPLTLTSYLEQYPAQPCGSEEDLLGTTNYEAYSSDFNTTVQELVVPPNTDGSSGSFPFGIALFSNDHLETFELFLMILEVISTANQTIDLGRTCAVGRVQSTLTNRDVIRLDPAVGSKTLPEQAGFVHLFNIVKTVTTQLTITISVETSSTGSVNTAVLDTDFTFPSRSYSILSDDTSIPFNITIIDDLTAEYNESFRLTLTATVAGTVISQEISMEVIVQDNEVIQLGFIGEAERTVVEGEGLRICAELQTSDFVRFDNQYAISTSDGSAIAGEDYNAVSVTYELLNAIQCWNLQTLDNDRAQSSRYFTFSFASGQGDTYTVIQPSSVTVIIADNDTVSPAAPVVQATVTDGTLIITWTVATQPISGFIGNITVDDQVIEVNVNSTTTTLTLDSHQVDKTYQIVICAENTAGSNCSSPYIVTPEPPATEPIRISTGTEETTTIHPGVIAGIVVLIFFFLLCFCVLLAFLLCCWKLEREKGYRPAKAEERERKRGRLGSNSSSDEISFEAGAYKIADP